MSEALMRVENQIIKDKLSQGKEGLLWLVDQVNPQDGLKAESLTRYIHFVGIVCRKDFLSVFRDAIQYNSGDFYAMHELNWWITIEEALTYLAIMKQYQNEQYSRLLVYLYGRG
ncbi:hypothetical protein [Halobacillus salinus]|uniref:hypothetical protein n=1 Tax=Halobacillus salinus TaxID=192814 RepID=UPI0009A71DBA|nr:hypothetical protein [Halobacillus salinus]